MSETSSERSKMTTIDEASLLVRQISMPVPPGDSTKAAIQRAYRALRGTLSRNRVKDLWYADVRVRVTADELLILRAAVQREETEALGELHLINERLARVEAILSGKNTTSGLDHESRAQAGGNDRPVAGA